MSCGGARQKKYRMPQKVEKRERSMTLYKAHQLAMTIIVVAAITNITTSMIVNKA